LQRKLPPVLHPPTLGSPSKRLAPIVFEALNEGNIIFRHFERRLVEFLKIYTPNEGGNRLGGDGKVSSTLCIKLYLFFFQIHPHKQIKIAYTSKSSLLIEETIVRCHPNFHSRSRNDVILVTLPDGRHVFARLHLVFSCTAFDREWRAALVTLFRTVITPANSRIGMRKILEDKESAFIDVSWIQRSVYAVPDFNDDLGRFFTIIDVVDSDMFLRLHNLNTI
jgi:hypothetical protein